MPLMRRIEVVVVVVVVSGVDIDLQQPWEISPTATARLSFPSPAKSGNVQGSPAVQLEAAKSIAQVIQILLHEPNHGEWSRRATEFIKLMFVPSLLLPRLL